MWSAGCFCGWSRIFWVGLSGSKDGVVFEFVAQGGCHFGLELRRHVDEVPHHGSVPDEAWAPIFSAEPEFRAQVESTEFCGEFLFGGREGVPLGVDLSGAE